MGSLTRPALSTWPGATTMACPALRWGRSRTGSRIRWRSRSRSRSRSCRSSSRSVAARRCQCARRAGLRPGVTARRTTLLTLSRSTAMWRGALWRSRRRSSCSCFYICSYLLFVPPICVSYLYLLNVPPTRISCSYLLLVPPALTSYSYQSLWDLHTIAPNFQSSSERCLRRNHKIHQPGLNNLQSRN